jgi:magnesium chelatase subunit H
MLSLTGFSLVGGPAYNDAKAAEVMLAGMDVPTSPPTPSSSRPCKTGPSPIAV